MADAFKQDFELHAGDSRTLRIPLTNPDGTPAVVGASATVKWWAGSNARQPVNQVPLKKTGSIIIEGVGENAQSIVIVNLVPDDTIDLAPRNYYHETEVTDGPVVLTVSSGTMKIKASLVR